MWQPLDQIAASGPIRAVLEFIEVAVHLLTLVPREPVELAQPELRVCDGAGRARFYSGSTGEHGQESEEQPEVQCGSDHGSDSVSVQLLVTSDRNDHPTLDPATMLMSVLRTVAALLLDDLAVFEFGVVCEVFGIDRTSDGVPPIEFRVCGPRAGEPLRPTTGGLQVVPEHGLEGLTGADVVAVPAAAIRAQYPAEALEALRAAADAGATLLSVCSGAFVLGAAGLLDGRRCTTHWMHAEELRFRHPRARIDPDVLFVDDGRLVTSAGTAAGIDACLHLVRRELGSEVANTMARRMVVPPQRDGGQRQFVQQPVPPREADSLAPVLSWVQEHLDVEHTVTALAERARMSSRTFARRFVAETGTTPHRWLSSQRVLLAQRLLESTDLHLEVLAQRCGFGTAALLRHHFRRSVGVTPAGYRRTFRTGREDGRIPA